MSWVAVAIGGSALVGAGATMYGANKAANSAPPPRNLGNEINTVLGAAPAVNEMGRTSLQTQLGGGINVEEFLRQRPDFAEPYNNVLAENGGDRTRTMEWLQRAMADSGIDPAGVPRSGGIADTLGSLQGTQDLLNAGSATFQRGANLGDMETYAPRAEALRRSINPEYYAALGGLDTAAGQTIGASEYETALGQQALAPSATFNNGAVRNVRGPRMDNALLGALGSVAGGQIDSGPLQAELQKQALSQLQTGGALTEQEAQQARNEARAAAEARGLSYSPGAQADEILNLDKYRRTRSESNQAFASAVDQQRFNQRQQSLASRLATSDAARGYATLGQNAQLANQQTDLARNAQGLAASDFALRAAAQRSGQLATADAMSRSRGTEQFGRLATAAQLRGASAYDPASVLGSVDNRLNSTQTIGAVPDYLSQLLGYGSDLNNTNYNAQASANLNSANAYTALGGGILSAGGQLGGAMIMKGAKTGA